jgi:hypothetical protein
MLVGRACADCGHGNNSAVADDDCLTAQSAHELHGLALVS